MRLLNQSRPNVDEVLNSLKDFQRDTVEYVFRRLYLDDDRVSRFLISDEVGLGKTLVARGVIAKAVHDLWDSVDRIDVIYICSNQDIARQNINRLNITSEREFQHASRATLLPIKLHQLKDNKLNFVSLTPGTSFDLRSRTGVAWERAVLFHILRGAWHVSEAILSNLLRGDVKKKYWPGYLNYVEDNETIDKELKSVFLASVQQSPHLRSTFDELASEIGSRRFNLTYEMRVHRNEWIGELRRLLAHTSLSALEPDLVILDEFQRFKHLLDEENDLAVLAQQLFDFPEAKVLLLSATPYKMYTMQNEQDEDHSEDFRRTVSFLLNGAKAEKEVFEKSISDYRNAFFHIDHRLESINRLKAAKTSLEEVLLKVMVRTERLAVSLDRNGMLSETLIAGNKIKADDLLAFVELDKIANQLDAGDQVEYWKSSAYPLNMMEGYKLKRKFSEACDQASYSKDLFNSLQRAKPYLLHYDEVQRYQRIGFGNARLRALVDHTLGTNNWQLLWLPPSIPYYAPEGPFAWVGDMGKTKTLIFSAWRIVPKAISVLLSYEAERRMLGEKRVDFDYSELTRKRRALLNFAYSNERLTGMPVFCLTYPCFTLASMVDPLVTSRELFTRDIPSLFYLFHKIKIRVANLLSQAADSIPVDDTGPVDERWYWAALALLDRHFNSEVASLWLESSNSDLAWSGMLQSNADEGDGESRFHEHVQEFVEFFQTGQLSKSGSPVLGRRPKDLEEILTWVALASPAVASLRSLLRVTGESQGLPEFLAAGAQAGLGFRTLFNQPDTISLLQSLYDEDAYWKAALRYSVDGNLQAVLDEYAHVLRESLGMVDHEPEEVGLAIGETIRQSLSIRAPSLQFDEVVLDEKQGTIEPVPHGIRCRYALRFGDEVIDEMGGAQRSVDVRVAFNSPFRPFVLATTSVGQEGLDFHQYCHRVVHWNLPSNPVDLEQREGRIHRYKGHVIRRNLAVHYDLSRIRTDNGRLVDPWKQLFKLAVDERAADANDLVPYWVYEAEQGYKIERQIPMLPLSREIGHFERLKKSLVAYRSVIGQARQQELLEFLAKRVPVEMIGKIVAECAIDLQPPR